MKHLLTIFLPFLLFQIATAQEFDVREFKADPTDLAARRYEKRTVNDEPSAIIKVITNIRGMRFDSNLGIVDVEHKDEGYWIYIAPRERRIRLLAEGFLPQDVDLPEPAQSFMVYSMIVTTLGHVTALDMARITFRMNQDNVYIRSGGNAPVLNPGNNAVFRVAKGEQSFRFIKPGFTELQRTIDVQDDQLIEITLEPGAPTTNLSLPGWIIITSEPEGAEVYLNEQRVGTTPYQGRHIAGEYNLMLSYPLYHEHFEQFSLGEGATVTLPPFEMKSRFGYWQVRSTPEIAEVLLDGRVMGNTPLSRTEIGSGIHELTVRMPLYHEHKENFTIEDGDDKRFDIMLKEAFGHLSITSEPDGADIFIDGSHVGTTPWENPQKPSGRYNVRITKDLYSDANDQLVVRDGERTDRFIPMGVNFGILEVNAAESDIYLNDSRVGSRTWRSNLPPGQYKVRATKDRHIDDEREVFVVAGQTELITLDPEPRQGALSIVSSPFETRGAGIWINGQKIVQTTPAVIPLMTGTYNVSVRRQDYLDVSQTVEIIEGREHELVFDMQTFEGSALEKSRKHRTAKIIYGTSMVAAAATGAYFQYSSMTLADEYKTATTDATAIYDKLETHDLISYVAIGTAIPLGIMTIIKASQQRRALKGFDLSAAPVRDGAFFSLVYRF